MQRRLAVGPKGNVPEEGDDLDLLGDRNFPVVLRLPIEETEHRIAAGADAGELGGPRSLPPPDRRVRFCPFSACARSRFSSSRRVVVLIEAGITKGRSSNDH